MTYPLIVFPKPPAVVPDEFEDVVFHLWNRELGFLEVRTPTMAALYNLDSVALVELPDLAAFLAAGEEVASEAQLRT